MKILFLAFWVLLTSSAQSAEIDVYLIAGQSNAINFASEAAQGDADLGFELHFARTSRSFLPPYTKVLRSFTDSLLAPELAITELAKNLHDERDIALFAHARTGAPLAIEEGRSYTWFPGDNPANGEIFDTNMYGNFVTWTNARLSELEANGDTPIVRGLFWFQGERDAVIGISSSDHETNFTNLIYRIREDFGENLPIVATRIREVGEDIANRVVVNQAMENVAQEVPFLSVVDPAGFSWVSETDVHLDATGLFQLATPWAQKMQTLQVPPDLLKFAVTPIDLLLFDSNNELSLTVNAEAVAEGYFVDLEYSTDLHEWFRVTTETTPFQLLDSTPQVSGDLVQRYKLSPDAPNKLYWRISLE